MRSFRWFFSYAILLIAVILFFASNASYVSAAVTKIWEIESPGTGDGQFSGLNGVDIDPVTKFIAVTDYRNDNIQFLKPDGSFSYRFGTNGTNPYQFIGPYAVLFDGAGHLYIADKFRIHKYRVAYDGSAWTVTYMASWDGVGGIGSSGYFQSLAIDGTTLYASDSGHNRIIKITNINSFGSSSSVASVFKEFTASPYGLAIGDGGLYVGLSDNYLYKLNLNDAGILAQNNSIPYASMDNLHFSRDGYLYAQSSSIIRRFTPDLSSYETVIDKLDNIYDGLAIDDQTGDLYMTYDRWTLYKYNMGTMNNQLSGLAVPGQSIRPPFHQNTTSYTSTVDNGIDGVRITPTAVDASSVTVNGNPVASGNPSDLIPLTVGVNTINIDVFAQNGAKKTYTISVTRSASSNTYLSGLTTSAGSFNQAFSKWTMNYTKNVPFSTSSITVTPTLEDSTATVTVNGNPVTNGHPSIPISLSVGNNTIQIETTAQNGYTFMTTTLVVTRAPGSTNANLSGLTASTGTFNEAFASSKIAYTQSVAHEVTSLKVTPTTSHGNATVTVNGNPVTSGSASGAIELNVGTNTITVVVTAQNGTTQKTYTLTVTRAASSDADLSGLTASTGMFNEAFAPGTIAYTQSVAHEVTSLKVTPTTSHGNATVTVNGNPVTNGSASGAIELNVGANTITVVVEAEDGTTKKTYTLTVTRAASSDADLSGLTASTGMFNEAFAPGTIAYTQSVAHEVTSLKVTPTTSHGNATVTVNGNPVTSGSASGAIELNVGANTLTVVVTAQNGTTQKTYTLTVTRAASSDANLSGLAASTGTFNEAFASGKIAYTQSVVHEVTSLKVTPTTSHGNATVTVNGNPVTSGSASGAIELNVGANTITVVVTAQNGTTQKTYTLSVTRAASSDANLSGLAASTGTFNEALAPGTIAYTQSVAHEVTSLKVTPTTSHGNATVTVNGNPVTNGSASGAIELNVGANTITVVVEAEDGTTQKTYTLTVTRAASSDADLSGLTASTGTFNESFAPGTIAYTQSVAHEVTSLKVTPTVNESNATVTVNGNPVTSGSASGAIELNVGTNTITVVVTAQNGTTQKTYTLTVTRAASSDANLSGLTASTGMFNEAFASGTNAYTQSVAHEVKSLTVTPTVNESNATVTVNGNPVTSGSVSGAIELNVGANTIKVVVTAEDGTTQKTYTLTVTRAGSSSGTGTTTTVPSMPVIDLNGVSFDPATIDTTKPSVTINVTPKDGVAYVSIPASILTSFESKNAHFLIEIQTPYGAYRVPVNLASLIPGLKELLAENNLDAGDVSFKITLTDMSGNKDIQTAFADGLPKGKVMGATVDFSITIIHTKTKQMVGKADQFSNALTRIIPMPRNMTGMPEQWGAFRYNETTKTFEFVPARSVKIEGIWYVMIYSYSNSVYVVADNPVSFADVSKHWSLPFVQLAAAKGLVEGVGGGKYEPERTVTRAEFAAMLVRVLGRSESTNDAAPYSDVKQSDWYFGEVAAAKELGLLDFVKGSSFKPNQPLTREEMASMLAAALSLEKLKIPPTFESLGEYKDIKNVDADFLEDVRLMVNLQIMTGTDDDAFSPKGESTRAQAAAVFIRTLRALEIID